MVCQHGRIQSRQLDLSILILIVTNIYVPFSELCSGVLATWWDEGCEYDYSDAECILDQQNVMHQEITYNPTAGCGWGGLFTEGRSHHYNCPGNEQRTCTTDCYVPCRK